MRCDDNTGMNGYGTLDGIGSHVSSQGAVKQKEDSQPNLYRNASSKKPKLKQFQIFTHLLAQWASGNVIEIFEGMFVRITPLETGNHSQSDFNAV